MGSVLLLENLDENMSDTMEQVRVALTGDATRSHEGLLKIWCEWCILLFYTGFAAENVP